ncbi:MAG: type I-G CRISPR-associated protein Cas8g1/Csx17 [Acidimicrobiales bacterium]
MSTHRLVLAGCAPEPLGSYLKALGIFRLVTEQRDADAMAFWGADEFVLQSHLAESDLEDFLLHWYRPTPVLSPWNKSSGFGPEGVGELQVIESSQDERLAPYRRATEVARKILAEAEEKGWDKTAIIQSCRSRLPDECVAWIDAAVVLTPDSPVFPPLLGTGGNVGRLELSRNFHQRLLDVLALGAKVKDRSKALARSERWLQDALWNLGLSAGIKESPGQFDPGSAGGTNSSSLGKGVPVLNPWDYVLMVEGTLLFASGSARRLGIGNVGRSAAPFTAGAAAVGYDSASADEPVKGEIWLPLWRNPASLRELRRLMSEGRIDWRGRQARTGLEFAKAASTLGVDRGIESFSRQVVVERFGQASVALAAGRVEVGTNPQGVLPLAELDRWLGRFRRAGDLPLGIRHALRRVDLAAFAVTLPGARRSPGSLARVLAETAVLEGLVARARTLRDRADIPPVSGLSADRWLRALVVDLGDTGGARELRLAVALASCRDRSGTASEVPGSLREMLCPISCAESGAPRWGDATLVEGLGTLPVTSLLSKAHARRATDLLAAKRRQPEGGRDGGQLGTRSGVGLLTRFSDGLTAGLADITALVSGAIDEDLLTDLLRGCMLLDWQRAPFPSRDVFDGDIGERPIPPSLAITGPFFARQPLRPRRPETAGQLNGTSPSWALVPEPEWPALLASGRADLVMTRALRRLKIAGHDPVVRPSRSRTAPGESVRLGGALLVPMSSLDGSRLLRRVCPPDELSPSIHQEMTEEVDDAQA